MKFHLLAGNGPLKTQLSALFDTGRLPHALILEGPPGSGKGTLARMLAQAAVCRDEGEKPCGTCLPCRKVVGGYHPDVIEKTDGKGARSFHIETVRAVRADAFVQPNEADVKVYILKNVQNMSDGAQNALLKILEDPPAYILFLLTCESASTLLPTILSRAPVFTMSAVTETDAIPILRERFPDQPEDALHRAAALSDGNIGRMIDGLSGGTFAESADLARRMAEAVAAETELPLLSLSAAFLGDKEKTRAVLSMLLLLFRDACMCRDGFTDRMAGTGDESNILRSRLTQAQLLSMIEIVERAQSALDRSVNQTLLATWFPATLRACGDHRRTKGSC